MKPYKGLNSLRYKETDEGVAVTLTGMRLKSQSDPFKIIGALAFIPIWVFITVASEGGDGIILGLIAALIGYVVIRFFGLVFQSSNYKKTKFLMTDRQVKIFKRNYERSNLSPFRVWGTHTHNNVRYDVLSIDHELATIRLGYVPLGKGHNITQGLNELAGF